MSKEKSEKENDKDAEYRFPFMAAIYNYREAREKSKNSAYAMPSFEKKKQR